MLSHLSMKMASGFISWGIVEKKDREIYAYSFEILLATILNFLTLCLLAIITDTVAETAAYLSVFLPLRQLVGGYHAKNHFRCFLILLFVYIVFLLVLWNLPVSSFNILIGISTLISWFVVFKFAPVADENNPLTVQEVARFRTKSRIAIICCSVIIGVVIISPLPDILAVSMSLGVLSITFSLVAGIIKQRLISHSLLKTRVDKNY